LLKQPPTGIESGLIARHVCIRPCEETAVGPREIALERYVLVD
jgi:hypothetical protein